MVATVFKDHRPRDHLATTIRTAAPLRRSFSANTQKTHSQKETMVTTRLLVMLAQGTKDPLQQGTEVQGAAVAMVAALVAMVAAVLVVAMVVVSVAMVLADSPEVPPTVAMEAATAQAATVPPHHLLSVAMVDTERCAT